MRTPRYISLIHIFSFSFSFSSLSSRTTLSNSSKTYTGGFLFPASHPSSVLFGILYFFANISCVSPECSLTSFIFIFSSLFSFDGFIIPLNDVYVNEFFAFLRTEKRLLDANNLIASFLFILPCTPRAPDFLSPSSPRVSGKRCLFRLLLSAALA